jgi:hypothetical protein
LIDAVRAAGDIPAWPAALQIEVAEARAEAGLDGVRELALEAARAARRRWVPDHIYAPEAMLRCAALLQGSDPAEAASLLHVARRWVVQSLPHVPAEALRSFVYDVAVNRQLLGDDAEVAAAGQPT